MTCFALDTMHGTRQFEQLFCRRVEELFPKPQLGVQIKFWRCLSQYSRLSKHANCAKRTKSRDEYVCWCDTIKTAQQEENNHILVSAQLVRINMNGPGKSPMPRLGIPAADSNQSISNLRAGPEIEIHTAWEASECPLHLLVLRDHQAA